MLTQALLAGAELGINRVLRLDATALPRLAGLQGRVIAIDCNNPRFELHVMPSGDGLRLASHWEGDVHCRLIAPAGSLLRLATASDKTAVLHGPDLELHGDSGVLLDLVGILQDLELDWEYELSRWLGPLATQLIGSNLRSGARWGAQSLESLRYDLADYLSEESRSLVGSREAETRFAELDELQLRLDRLEARLAQLSSKPAPSENA
jgi:ubiquinone biosynthesis protein UbiJ